MDLLKKIFTTKCSNIRNRMLCMSSAMLLLILLSSFLFVKLHADITVCILTVAQVAIAIYLTVLCYNMPQPTACSDVHTNTASS